MLIDINTVHWLALRKRNLRESSVIHFVFWSYSRNLGYSFNIAPVRYTLALNHICASSTKTMYKKIFRAHFMNKIKSASEALTPWVFERHESFDWYIGKGKRRFITYSQFNFNRESDGIFSSNELNRRYQTIYSIRISFHASRVWLFFLYFCCCSSFDIFCDTEYLSPFLMSCENELLSIYGDTKRRSNILFIKIQCFFLSYLIIANSYSFSSSQM